MLSDKTKLIEELAKKEHASWSHWMAYLFQVCEKQPDGSVVVSPALVERWQRQVTTPYEQLSEREKQSDRDEVAHILPMIYEYFASNRASEHVKMLIGMEALDDPIASMFHPAHQRTKENREAGETITIIVNGRKRTVEEKEVSFAQIVDIAFDPQFDPHPIPKNPTVIYRHGPQGKPEGSLLSGETVKLIDGMIFNVAITSNA